MYGAVPGLNHDVDYRLVHDSVQKNVPDKVLMFFYGPMHGLVNGLERVPRQLHIRCQDTISK